MKFGVTPVADALGAIVAHGERRPGLSLRKGDVVTAEHIAQLQQYGVAELVVARLEPGDSDENAAAAALAETVAGAHLRLDAPFTGRCNIVSLRAGLFCVDVAGVNAINDLDEAVTLATLAPMRAVVADEMVATVKIIPFAVPETILNQALAMGQSLLSIAPWRPKKIAVISTVLEGLKPATIEKTLRVLSERLRPTGSEIVWETRAPHTTQALAAAIQQASEKSDVIIIFGASAITDRRDVMPVAIEQAGGKIKHFGMPVDPGNLLLLGADQNDKPIIGAPGCARSPAENGFDFVLQRLLADVPVTSADIRRMGVGGLLMEIMSRPQPRQGGFSEENLSFSHEQNGALLGIGEVTPMSETRAKPSASND